MTARFSADDYAGAARALMPRGAAWSTDPASVQGRTTGALAQSLERVDAAAVQLLADTFPATTQALLAEWEASLGLPDPILGPGATDAQRRAAIVTRLVGAGGQSQARFIAFAATLGFAITIGTYAPLRAGRFNAGDAVLGEVWAHAWSIHVVANTGGLTSTQLKAELDAIRPAETTTLLA